MATLAVPVVRRVLLDVAALVLFRSKLLDPKDRHAALLAPFVSVVVLHALLCVIMLLLHQWAATGLSHAFVWAPPLVFFAFRSTIIALIGMIGRQSIEGVREWWSRSGRG